MEGDIGGSRHDALAIRPVSAREAGAQGASRRGPSPVVMVAALVVITVLAAPLVPAASASATAGAEVSTVIGGTGVGPGTTIAQDPVSLATTGSGALDIGDGTAMVIRSLSPSGVETTVACAGDIATSGYGGDGGPATDASCNTPDGLVTDRAGDTYLADDQNNRVRLVAGTSGSRIGQATTAGSISTVAGNGTWGYSGDGGPASAAELAYPAGVGLDASGNLVICDSGNAAVRVVAVTDGTFYGVPMTAGDIYTVAGTGTTGSSGDGGRALQAELDQPDGLAIDGHGNLVVADLGNNQIRVVAAADGVFYGIPMTAGDIYGVAGTGRAGFAGDGRPAAGAELDRPAGVAVDGRGDLIVADTGNSRVRVVAASSGTVLGRTVRSGDIYTVVGTGTAGFSGDGGPAGHAALDHPGAVAVEGDGDLVVADTGNHRVRVITSRTGLAFGRQVAAGTIRTIVGTRRLGGFSGDGGPAPGALLNLPTGVAVSGSGGVAVADQNNNRVRLVPARTAYAFGQSLVAGDITTVAGTGTAGGGGVGGPGRDAELDAPSGVAFDAHGNLLIAEFAGNRVLVVAATTGEFFGRSMTAGDLYVLAGTGAAGSAGDGGPAAAAELYAPEDVSLDSAGDVIVTEFYGNRVRLIAGATGTSFGRRMESGRIYTLAGTGSPSSSGDGGPATSASIDQPVGVAVDAHGNLVVGDYLGQRVRVVAASSGTYYGIPMTAGDMYTVAGNGTKGTSGDGGPAVAAELSSPAGVAVDRAGNLVVADSAADKISVVADSTGTYYGQPMVAGEIASIAGGGTAGCETSRLAPVPAGGVGLSNPLGVAVAPDGSLRVSDTADNCVRALSGPTGVSPS
jgi:sugar lactone lactonase YvrE